MSDRMWIIAIACLAASSCALLGPFLVLRKLSMLGDAISHAVLPGIVAAFLLTGSRSALPMLLGAGALGLATAFLTETLRNHGKLQEDASIGVTFTWLFALGVILVSRYGSQVDLDADCVLYGEIVFAPLDTLELWGRNIGPRAAWVLGGVTLANLIFVALGYKQLKLCAFDSALAAALGMSVALWHYLLMAFVSVTTVAAFESVGAILVVAMLVVPANTAYLLTDRLWIMCALSVAVGILSAVLGYLLAVAVDGSIAAGIAVAGGALFALAAVFSPSHGALARWIVRRRAGRAEPEISGASIQ